MIGTSFLETGIDLPKCNLVVRFDGPQHFTSYAQGKARARGPAGLHCMLTAEESRREQQLQLACFHAVEQVRVFSMFAILIDSFNMQKKNGFVIKKLALCRVKKLELFSIEKKNWQKWTETGKKMTTNREAKTGNQLQKNWDKSEKLTKKGRKFQKNWAKMMKKLVTK